MASLSDLEEQLRESEANSARLRAEIAARKADEEDELAGEGISFPEGTRDGDDGSGAKFEEDFLVERLGGAEPVRKLRASVSAALTVEAKPLPEWQRNMGATGKK